jgi:hypothetical protein
MVVVFVVVGCSMGVAGVKEPNKGTSCGLVPREWLHDVGCGIIEF